MRQIQGIAANIAALAAAPLTATGHNAGFLLVLAATLLAITIPAPQKVVK